MAHESVVNPHTTHKDYQRAQRPPHIINIVTSGTGALIGLDQDGVVWRMIETGDLVRRHLDPAGAGWHELEYGSTFYSCVPKRKPQ